MRSVGLPLGTLLLEEREVDRGGIRSDRSRDRRTDPGDPSGRARMLGGQLQQEFRRPQLTEPERDTRGGRRAAVLEVVRRVGEDRKAVSRLNSAPP